MVVSPLEWDSDFFQMRIAKAEIKTLTDAKGLADIEKDLRSAFDLIYIFNEPGIRIDEIGLKDATLVDNRVIYTLTSPLDYQSCANVVQIAPSEPTDDIIELALISGRYSRFRIDKKMPTGSFERLYTQWIYQSLNLSIATEVFCYIINDKPRGLVTLYRGNDCCTIGLVAVDPAYQHHGIGTALIHHACSFVRKHGNLPISITTQQNNKPACNLYSKCGFTLFSSKEIWHWWL